MAGKRSEIWSFVLPALVVTIVLKHIFFFVSFGRLFLLFFLFLPVISAWVTLPKGASVFLFKKTKDWRKSLLFYLFFTVILGVWMFGPEVP